MPFELFNDIYSIQDFIKIELQYTYIQFSELIKRTYFLFVRCKSGRLTR